MKLFFYPGSCSQVPLIVAHELGLSLQLVAVDLAQKQTADGRNFLDINPNGYVPALELDNGRVLTEAHVIAQYLTSLKPGNGLMPAAGQFEHFKMLELLNFITSEVHKPMGSFFNPALHPETRAATEQLLGRRLNYLANKLSKNEFLTGNSFTVADAYLFVVLNWAGWVKFDLTAWPLLQAFQQRVAARAAVQAAQAAEQAAVGK